MRTKSKPKHTFLLVTDLPPLPEGSLGRMFPQPNEKDRRKALGALQALFGEADLALGRTCFVCGDQHEIPLPYLLLSPGGRMLGLCEHCAHRLTPDQADAVLHHGEVQLAAGTLTAASAIAGEVV